MKKLNFRSILFSALAGIVLALVVVLSAVGFTQRTFAEGDFCRPPEGYNTLGCATRGDGVKYCVNYGSQGGTCGSNDCVNYPELE